LVVDGADPENPVILGEVAHIIADSPYGPRGAGQSSNEPDNSYENLILLCGDHHKLVDSQPNSYPTDVLREMKLAHERQIKARLRASEVGATLKEESLTLTALTVTHVPRFVYSAVCKFSTGEDDLVKAEIEWPKNKNVLAPFLLKTGNLYCFQDLRRETNPFSQVIERGTADRLRSDEYCSTPEGERDFVTLLNRSMYKYASRRRVRYDPDHRRFYFECTEAGKSRTVRYRSLTGRSIERQVVWNPVRRATGEHRRYWWHLAAGLRFHRVADASWVLSIRPERHLTQDGESPLPSKMIGRRVTSAKSRMFNYQYLTEVGFWRDFLCNGDPRMIVHYGQQSAIISGELYQLKVNWPGIPNDDKPIITDASEDDLFTSAEFDAALAGRDEEAEDDEEDEQEEEW
jgi:hypothetical protein